MFKIKKLLCYLGLFINSYGDVEEAKYGEIPGINRRLKKLEKINKIDKIGNNIIETAKPK